MNYYGEFFLYFGYWDILCERNFLLSQFEFFCYFIFSMIDNFNGKNMYFDINYRVIKGFLFNRDRK